MKLSALHEEAGPSDPVHMVDSGRVYLDWIASTEEWYRFPKIEMDTFSDGAKLVTVPREFTNNSEHAFVLIKDGIAYTGPEILLDSYFSKWNAQSIGRRHESIAPEDVKAAELALKELRDEGRLNSKFPITRLG
jgi:hypothetical protein